MSPPLDEATESYHARDQVEALASDQLLIVHLRPSGNLHALVRQRLEQQLDARTIVAIGNDQLVPSELADDLMGMKALGWYLMTGSNGDSLPLEVPERSAAPIMTELKDGADYLTHCTRSLKGAWPDQGEDEFLDDLILGESSKERSCLSSLMRIIRMQRLIATSQAIRGEVPVVSFTSNALHEIPAMRTYRAHRGQWDFEPYGVCIRRQTLVDRGARAVQYADETTWDQLASRDKPFFHKLGSKTSSIDWSVEREWRVIGDLDLAKLPVEDVRVFVPTMREATLVASISPWPVVVVA